MRRFSYIFGLSLLFLTILISCHQTENKQTITTQLTFDSLKTNRVYHINNDSTKPSCHLSVSFVYPLKGLQSNSLKRLKKIFISTMFGQAYTDSLPSVAAKSYADYYVHSYKEDAKLFYAKDPDVDDKDSEENPTDYYSYFEKLSNKIIYNKHNLLSLQVERKNYKGGDSSFTSFRNYVIDLRTGELLTDESIFNANYEKRLHYLFVNKLLGQNKVETISDLEDLGYFGIEEIAPNNNFYINDEGITYIFNKGESSVLPLNEIRITFTFEEIQPILKPDSPIQSLF